MLNESKITTWELCSTGLASFCQQRFKPRFNPV